MYINVFANREYEDANVEVVNVSVDNYQRPLLYSVGIHPWYISKENYDDYIQKFHIIVPEKQCIAIGECGLDKSFESNYDLQVKIFLQQIKTANILKKSIILYSLKAWKEITEILQNQKNKMPLIIPSDYLPDDDKLLQPIKDYYISFDKSVYLGDEKTIKYLKNISSKKILFHNTDEDISIKDIYQSASDILKIDLNTLQHQILENFYRAFMLEKLPV